MSLEENIKFPFVVGKPYTRKNILSLLGEQDPKGGSWYTGYSRLGENWFLFCGIGTPGRTGHNYHNELNKNALIWFGKEGTTINSPSIRKMISGDGGVCIFIRHSDRDPFTFLGLGRPVAYENTSPVKIIWGLGESSDYTARIEEVEKTTKIEDVILEGEQRRVYSTTFERSPRGRKICLDHWGYVCFVCGFDFFKMYGDIGKGFIHVHHEVPLSIRGQEYELNPIKDLKPVCPNCHSMIHRSNPALSVDSLKAILKSTPNSLQSSN